MKIKINISALLALVAFLVVSLAAVDPASAKSCLSSSDTRKAISEGRAAHLAVIKDAAKKFVRGDVVKAELCQGDQGLVYQLVTLSRQGAVSRLVLDAQSGKLVSKGGS